jgi:uncharacterized protein (TIGR02996 family)
MLAIVVSRAEEPRWRRTYVTTDVAIGHLPDNQLVLDRDGIDAHHLRIRVRDGKVIVAATKSSSGARVRNKWLDKPRPVRADDPITAGAYTLYAFLAEPEPIGAFLSRNPMERQLLDAIAAGDAASRLVYADWLESIGDANRAELLRLQHMLERDVARRRGLRARDRPAPRAGGRPRSRVARARGEAPDRGLHV